MPLSHEDPVDIILQDQSLHNLQQVLEGVVIRVGQPKTRLWTWVAVELVSPGPRATQLRRGGRVGSPTLLPLRFGSF